MVNFAFDGDFSATWQLPLSLVPDAVYGSAFQVFDDPLMVKGNAVVANILFSRDAMFTNVCAGTKCAVLDLLSQPL